METSAGTGETFAEWTERRAEATEQPLAEWREQTRAEELTMATVKPGDGQAVREHGIANRPRARARGAHPAARRGTTRARRCKSGRRRSGATSRGGLSPPDDPEGEHLAALLAAYIAFTNDLVELLPEEALAELRALRGGR
jgi:hypothetical protein